MKINNRQQVLAIAAIAIVGLFLLDRALITPLTNGWKARSQKITDLQRDITRGEELLKAGPRYQALWGRMKTNTLSSTNAELKLLEAFQRWSRQSDVSISSVQPQWKAGDEDYSTLECHANASGSIKAISEFLYHMEKDPMALRIESLEITSRDEAGKTLALSLQVSGLVLGEPPQ